MPARYHRQLLLVEDDAVVFGLEPLHGVLLAQPVLRADPAGLAAPVADIEAGSAHHDVEVHAVDADAGVIPDNNINVNVNNHANWKFMRRDCGRNGGQHRYRGAWLVL